MSVLRVHNHPCNYVVYWYSIISTDFFIKWLMRIYFQTFNFIMPYFWVPLNHEVFALELLSVSLWACLFHSYLCFYRYWWCTSYFLLSQMSFDFNQLLFFVVYSNKECDYRNRCLDSSHFLRFLDRFLDSKTCSGTTYFC